MITCTIDGRKAYPQSGSSIKVIFENPLIKDREAQTMEITFPLSIMENLKIFGSVGRLDVAKHTAKFNDCYLYVDNILVISGSGTITTYTDKDVKLQIKCGSTRSDEFPSDWDKVYIDNPKGYGNWPKNSLLITSKFNKNMWEFQMTIPGVGEYPAIYDETNDKVWNCRYMADAAYWQVWDVHTDFVPIFNARVQPYLNHVIRMVLEWFGYSVGYCFFDNKPWNKILIYNARRAEYSLCQALPHWTVKKFLREVQLLFNCRFLFDRRSRTVDIRSISETLEEKEYECLDEFSTDYNEEGAEMSEASNLRYNLSDYETNKYNDLSDTIIKHYPEKSVQSYKQLEYMMATEQQKDRDMNIWVTQDDGKKYVIETVDEEKKQYIIHRVCRFQHLVRDESANASEVELNIVPVAMDSFKVKTQMFYFNGEVLQWSDSKEDELLMPASSGDENVNDKDSQLEYVPIMDAIDGENIEDKAEDERMEIYFYGVSTALEGSFSGTLKKYSYAYCNTEYSDGSLAFANVDQGGMGTLHKKMKLVENKEQIVIKFIAYDIPDPKQLFVFRGKRFVCDKLEATVTDTGISRLWTGYFYELNS